LIAFLPKYKCSVVTLLSVLAKQSELEEAETVEAREQEL
jgi:hypothetical protein